MSRLYSGHLVTFSVLPRDNRMGSPRIKGTCDCKEKRALIFSPFVHVQPSQGRFHFITISPSPLKVANTNSEQTPYLRHHAGLPNGPPSSGRLQETLVCVCVCDYIRSCVRAGLCGKTDHWENPLVTCTLQFKEFRFLSHTLALSWEGLTKLYFREALL